MSRTRLRKSPGAIQRNPLGSNVAGVNYISPGVSNYTTGRVTSINPVPVAKAYAQGLSVSNHLAIDNGGAGVNTTGASFIRIGVAWYANQNATATGFGVTDIFGNEYTRISEESRGPEGTHIAYFVSYNPIVGPGHIWYADNIGGSFYATVQAVAYSGVRRAAAADGTFPPHNYSASSPVSLPDSTLPIAYGSLIDVIGICTTDSGQACDSGFNTIQIIPGIPGTAMGIASFNLLQTGAPTSIHPQYSWAGGGGGSFIVVVLQPESFEPSEAVVPADTTGTGTLTAPGPQASGTGQQGETGTGTATAPAPGVVADGKQGETGTGTATAPSPAASGDGTSTPPGTDVDGTLTAPGPQASGNGTSTPPNETGSGTATAPAPGVDATGKQGETGSGTATVPGPNVTATGQQGETATGTVTAPGPQASGTINVPSNETGSGTLTAPGPQAEGSGGSAPPGTTGSGEVDAPGPSVTGTGHVDRTGTGTATAPGPSVSVDGTVTPPNETGSGEAVAPAPGVQATGKQGETGTVTVTAPGPQSAGVGKQGETGSGSGTAPAPSADGTGKQGETGQGTIVAPGPQATGTGVQGETGTGSPAAPRPGVSATVRLDSEGSGAAVIGGPTFTARGIVGNGQPSMDPTKVIPAPARSTYARSRARNTITLARPRRTHILV